MTAVRFHDFPDFASWKAAALRRVLDAAARATSGDGRFTIVAAGGETPRPVYRALVAAGADWARWEVFFGDERCLPPRHPERNSTKVAQDWLDRVPIPARQVHAIPAELGPARGAERYAAELRGIGMFDLVLLGLGEDGHVASLFPDHDWGEDAGAPDVIPVLDAPKPPPERVSLSAARLSRAREVLCLVSGPAKRDALARWRAGARLPAAAICPPSGVDVLVTG